MSLACPHCHDEIDLRKLPHQGMFKSFRICPGCGGRFTVDPRTKRRQAAFIVVALVALVFTLLLYYRGTQWLPPALAIYAVFAALLYWANKQVYFVPVEDPDRDDS